MPASACTAKFVGQAPEPNAAQIQLNCGTLVDLTARYLPAMTQRATAW